MFKEFSDALDDIYNKAFALNGKNRSCIQTDWALVVACQYAWDKLQAIDCTVTTLIEHIKSYVRAEYDEVLLIGTDTEDELIDIFDSIQPRGCRNSASASKNAFLARLLRLALLMRDCNKFAEAAREPGATLSQVNNDLSTYDKFNKQLPNMPGNLEAGYSSLECEAILLGALYEAATQTGNSPMLCAPSLAMYMKTCLDIKAPMKPLTLAFMVYATVSSFRLHVADPDNPEEEVTSLAISQKRARMYTDSLMEAYSHSTCSITISPDLNSRLTDMYTFIACQAKDPYAHAPLTASIVNVYIMTQHLLEGQKLLNHKYLVGHLLHVCYSAPMSAPSAMKDKMHLLTDELYDKKAPVLGPSKAALEKFWVGSKSKRTFDFQITTPVGLCADDGSLSIKRLIKVLMKEDDAAKEKSKWQRVLQVCGNTRTTELQWLIDNFHRHYRSKFERAPPIMETNGFRVFIECADLSGMHGLG